MAKVHFRHHNSEVIACFEDPLFTRAETIFYHPDMRLQALIGDQILEIGYLPKDLVALFCTATKITLTAPHADGHEVSLHANIKTIH